jgi:hypothetical protein
MGPEYSLPYSQEPSRMKIIFWNCGPYEHMIMVQYIAWYVT